MSSESIYQVWFKLADFSGWEPFTTELCNYETAHAVARTLPLSKVTRFGEIHLETVNGFG
ncbi:MAG: hypothetical protein LBQ86_01745 [Holophagales bacterium]|jgi:hypothetical protein|nr:hypothetical protein [Holophagales bacterium]